MADNVNKLLIVEQDPAVVELIGKVAKEAGYAVASAASGATFAQLLDSFQPSLVVMEPNLPDSDGVELLTALAARASSANILLLGSVDERIHAAAKELRASRGLATPGTLEKPLDAVGLATKLTALLHRSMELDADDLRRGIESGEFVPYYQPKVALAKDGWTVDGVEALARWQHPTCGLVMPTRFMPLAERSGLIADLTGAILSAALRQLREWQEQGLRLTCAVNLPPSLITDSSFPDRVAALLAENGVDGRQLVLEITETATIQNPTATMAILTRLRVKRIGIALDDFGTGYSSLTQLFEMPFSELKIDKSLVMNLPGSREAKAMIASLIAVGHNLGLKICAEGVENRGALELLATLGCDRCQGYFISRAIPASEVAAFAARWNEENSQKPARSRPKAAG